MADKKVRALLGTRKGIYIVESDQGRKRWKIGRPSDAGREVFHVTADPRHPGTLFAAVNSGFWGPMVRRSRNFGKTWEEVATPLTVGGKDRKPLFNEENPSIPVPRAVNNLWHIEPGHASEPKTVFIGVDPHMLFRSDDLADSWSPVPGINEHSTKDKWGPGAGGPCLHTIIVDPSSPRTMYIGISAAGTFRTDDGGDHWSAVNKGVETPFQPDKFPEVGQCVHHVVADPSNPSVFYRQDHGGMYVSRDRMDSWTRIGKSLQSDFGFVVASPRAAPGRAYFVPLDGESRVTYGGGLQVFEWTEKTKKFRPLMPGSRIPGEFGTHRESLATDTLDPAGIYVGTTTGQLVISPDAGKSWVQVPYQFPAIHSISVASPE